MKGKKGFTLIEVLASVMIMAITIAATFELINHLARMNESTPILFGENRDGVPTPSFGRDSNGITITNQPGSQADTGWLLPPALTGARQARWKGKIVPDPVFGFLKADFIG